MPQSNHSNLQNSKTNPSSVSLVEIFLRARELERAGKDVIHFDAGEPDYGPPQEVVNATTEAIRKGKSRYTEPGGIGETKNAISAHVERQFRVQVPSERILVTAGGRLALYLAFASLHGKSKVGIISPDWPAYRQLARHFQYETRFFNGSLENGWTLDLDEIGSSDCSALVLNYPNNPTGKMLDRSTFEEIVQIATENNMTLISDEVYSNFTFNDQKRHNSVLETSDLRYIFVTSLSKDYSMTGYRAAYTISDDRTISIMSKLNGLIMTSAPEFVQYAIIAALSCNDYLLDKVQMIKRRRDIAVRALKKQLNAEVYSPDGSLYLFPRLSTKDRFDSEKFALDLLEKQFVSISPGTTFGDSYKQHFRMTLLQSEKRIGEGIERMGELINST